MFTIVETPTYLSDAKSAGMNEDDRGKVIDFIARNPMFGDVLEGTGGARKLRVARRGGGKSGGFRVLFAYLGQDCPVILLAVFAKNEKSNISKSEAHDLAKALEALKSTLRAQRTKQ